MSTKLTLTVNAKTIKKGKDFAQKKRTSLSKLIEHYLKQITEEDQTEPQISPLVKSLSGIIKPVTKEHFKRDYAEQLSKKYQ